MTASPARSYGRFCWLELVTTNREAALRFYRQVFGFESRDTTLSEGELYSILSLKDQGEVGALYEMTPEVRAEKMPSHWGVYLAVEDAEEALVRAKAAGAKVIAEAFDAFEAGRMAIIQDPTGAPFHLWQAGTRKGATARATAPGMFCWHELTTKDLDRAEAFYQEVFGWEVAHRDGGKLRYTIFQKDGVPVAGALALGEAFRSIPSHWLSFFRASDCDQSAQLVVQAGGQILSPPQASPAGRTAVVRDPEGAVFALLTPP